MATPITNPIVHDIRVRINEAKAFLDQQQSVGAEAPNSILKLSKDGKSICSSTVDKFTDCVPLRYADILTVVTPPLANASAGVSGGGSFFLDFVTVAVDRNANIGDTGGAFFEQSNMDLGILELSKASGGFAVGIGYEFKNCRIISSLYVYRDFKIFVVWAQNISYVENKFDGTGKKAGAISSGKFDAATGKAGSGK